MAAKPAPRGGKPAERSAAAARTTADAQADPVADRPPPGRAPSGDDSADTPGGSARGDVAQPDKANLQPAADAAVAFVLPGAAPAEAAVGAVRTALSSSERETVAGLSAAIVQGAGPKTSRFDVQLTPEGLGRVDVTVVIDASGKVTASLSFDQADAARLVKTHEGELQAALTEAGLSLGQGALRIEHVSRPDPASTPAGNGAGTGPGMGGEGGQAQQGDPGLRGARSFIAAAHSADAEDVRIVRRTVLAGRGLDIRI
jgi:flagellar hook-length control protein FliK